jgi:type III secretion protein C
MFNIMRGLLSIAGCTMSLLVLVLVLVLTPATGVAAEVPWKKEKFMYVAQGKSLREFMQEFGASQGLLVVVDKAVEGTVNGKFDLLPESLMALMSANFGFVWYYDGSVLGIHPASDVRTEVIRLGELRIDRLRQTLDRLNIPDKRFPILYDAKQNTALVSGPKRYVDLVVQAARAVELGSSLPTDVRVVPLKYAWAADFTVTQSGQSRVVPGVASVMAQVYGNPAAAPSGLALERSPSLGNRLRAMVALGLSRGEGGIEREPSVEPPNAKPAAPTVLPPGDAGVPQFVADPRINAVIVRDRPENLARHEAAIHAMDTRSGVVEIEARVIEVNSDESQSLGIDWRAGGRRLDVQIGAPGFPRPGWGNDFSSVVPPPGSSVPDPTLAAGGTLTTVLTDAGRFLIARVSALAEQGKASLLSSPKVLTLENVEALLEDLDSFFVKVPGNLEVDLFSVSAGTSLRVTPLIVNENGERQIRLAIRIEDGAITSRTVEGLPVVRRSAINTQALIGDGQALLIAGYAREVDSRGQRAVPGLGNVPVLGWLFKSTDQSKQRMDRFFLLTPKVVSP